MNNIEILENFINKQKSNKGTFVPTDFEITALENLIKENKALKEGLKYRVNYCKLLEKELYANGVNYEFEKTEIEKQFLEE